MHPTFTAQLVAQHQDALRREASSERLARLARTIDAHGAAARADAPAPRWSARRLPRWLRLVVRGSAA